MSDPYRIPGTAPITETQPARSDSRRTLLWVALVISAAANAVISSTGLPVIIGIGFGLLTLACAVALVGHHRRRAR